MKIRHDFVTNSSSSSFIIARHKDCTRKEIMNELFKVSKKVKEVADNWDIDDEELLANLVDEFIFYPELILDDWKLRVTEFSNSDDAASDFIYQYGYMINTDHIRIASSGW